MRRLILFLLGFMILCPVVRAQEKPLITAHRETYLHAGPGDTYLEVAILPAGIEVEIVERNRIGNWLHVYRENERGEMVFDGWGLSGFFNLPEDLRYSQIPVNTNLLDADPSTVRSRSMAQLYTYPVIPTPDEAMGEIFQLGLKNGHNPAAVTKVGDSLTASELYLTPMNRADNDLGPYDYLEDTLKFFGDSTAVESVAARVGLTSYVVFDPMWADTTLCEPKESPLACEYRLKKPSVAFIMFGVNDVRHMTDQEFKEQIRQLVTFSLEQGVIPVLSTFSYHPDDTLWWQSVNFNLALGELATEYKVPLINLWAAARVLPDYGLDEDHAHMLNSGFPNLVYSSGHETWYGTSLRNLLTLCMLDELRRSFDMDKTLDDAN